MTGTKLPLPHLPPRYQHLSPPVHLQGGYGELWVVYDTYLERKVAYKRIKDDSNADQIVNEVRMLGAARSRNIVDIYDVFTGADGRPDGFVMEYLDGVDLDSFVHDGADETYRDVLLVLYEVACALADLHRLGITHRDLKPDNFRTNSAGVVKLFDFGISVDDPDYRTTDNRGTAFYAAPELYLPGALIESPLDIYAFGVCAWKLSTGRIPGPLRERPPTRSNMAPGLDTVVPQLGAEVGDLVARCLSPDPRARPGAPELVRVLERGLTRGRHIGVFSYGRSRELQRLDSTSPAASIGVRQIGTVGVTYDGLDFIITGVSGDVWVNNARAMERAVLPMACVLSFGPPSAGASRQHVSFASSRPGVMM